MKENRLMRQSDVVPSGILGRPINIIGAGAVGSWTALQLCKMGFDNITIYDFDNVDDVNMCSQFFRIKDIGQPKVEALARLIYMFTEEKIIPKVQRYESEKLDGIVIAAVDSMKVRAAIFNNHRGNMATKLVIDPRMAIENALMYTYDPNDEEQCGSYLKSLYTDDNAVQERCTGKATVYTANMLSALVVKTVKDYLTDTNLLKTAQWDIGNHLFTGYLRNDEPF